MNHCIQHGRQDRDKTKSTMPRRIPKTPEVYKPIPSEQPKGFGDNHGSPDESRLLFKVGIALTALSVCVAINTGQIAQSSYADGMSVGIAHAKQESYQQAYDKGVADGLAKAQTAYEKSLA
jgi:hypothetical protein